MKASGIPFVFGDDELWEVSTPNDFPTGKCYVVQIFKEHAIEHEGDERSRTHPGHGYPAYTEHILDVKQFVTCDFETWKAQLEVLYEKDKNRTDIAAFEMEKRDVQVRVEVEIKP